MLDHASSQLPSTRVTWRQADAEAQPFPDTEARRILRAKIKRMPWHADLPPEERQRRIEADVDRWWFLEIREAARRLNERSS